MGSPPTATYPNCRTSPLSSSFVRVPAWSWTAWPWTGQLAGEAVEGLAAGLAAGAIRMLFESPEQEANRLIKQLYQVNIDTAMAKQNADIAKQKYTGQVSIAVLYPDVRKMIELYAAGTGPHMALRRRRQMERAF
jgi:hypothetical protein